MGALALQVDVGNESSALAMAEAKVKVYGQIDILLNHTAILVTLPISRVPFDRVALDEWDRVRSVDLRGIRLCCRAAVPYMKREQWEDHEHFLRISIIGRAWPTRPSYPI